jgi:hypothetical protein
MIRQTDSRGFTIIEVVITGVISVVAFLALYTGIIFAEGRLVRDYHIRAAILQVSGELDIQTYWLYAYGVPRDCRNKEVIIDDPGTMNGHVIAGRMNLETPMDASETIGQSGEAKYKRVVVNVKWSEPTLNFKSQTVRMREDYYLKKDTSGSDDDSDSGTGGRGDQGGEL